MKRLIILILLIQLIAGIPTAFCDGETMAVEDMQKPEDIKKVEMIPENVAKINQREDFAQVYDQMTPAQKTEYLRQTDDVSKLRPDQLSSGDIIILNKNNPAAMKTLTADQLKHGSADQPLITFVHDLSKLDPAAAKQAIKEMTGADVRTESLKGCSVGKTSSGNSWIQCGKPGEDQTNFDLSNCMTYSCDDLSKTDEGWYYGNSLIQGAGYIEVDRNGDLLIDSDPLGLGRKRISDIRPGTAITVKEGDLVSGPKFDVIGSANINGQQVSNVVDYQAGLTQDYAKEQGFLPETSSSEPTGVMLETPESIQGEQGSGAVDPENTIEVGRAPGFGMDHSAGTASIAGQDAKIKNIANDGSMTLELEDGRTVHLSSDGEITKVEEKKNTESAAASEIETVSNNAGTTKVVQPESKESAKSLPSGVSIDTFYSNHLSYDYDPLSPRGTNNEPGPYSIDQRYIASGKLDYYSPSSGFSVFKVKVGGGILMGGFGKYFVEKDFKVYEYGEQAYHRIKVNGIDHNNFFVVWITTFSFPKDFRIPMGEYVDIDFSENGLDDTRLWFMDYKEDEEIVVLKLEPIEENDPDDYSYDHIDTAMQIDIEGNLINDARDITIVRDLVTNDFLEITYTSNVENNYADFSNITEYADMLYIDILHKDDVLNYKKNPFPKITLLDGQQIEIDFIPPPVKITLYGADSSFSIDEGYVGIKKAQLFVKTTNETVDAPYYSYVQLSPDDGVVCMQLGPGSNYTSSAHDDFRYRLRNPTDITYFYCAYKRPSLNIDIESYKEGIYSGVFDIANGEFYLNSEIELYTYDGSDYRLFYKGLDLNNKANISVGLDQANAISIDNNYPNRNLLAITSMKHYQIYEMGSDDPHRFVSPEQTPLIFDNVCHYDSFSHESMITLDKEILFSDHDSHVTVYHHGNPHADDFLENAFVSYYD